MSSQLELSFPAERLPHARATVPITRRRLRFVALAALCGVVGFGLFGQLAQNRRLDSQVSTLADQNAKLQRDIDQSETEIVLAQTPAWLEAQARKLGYVLPGERVFVITPPGSTTASGGGVAAPLPVLPTPTPSPSSAASPSPQASASPTPQSFQLPAPSPHG